MLPIYDVTPFTLLDFPGKVAAIVWFSGCNMRCGYCHNPEITKGKGRRSPDDVLTFLRQRQGLLDGAVLSGGEATLYPGLADFAASLKDLGYAIKLDTNGTKPGAVRQMLERNLVDYIALDYKAPPGKYRRITASTLFGAFDETLIMLCGQSAVPFEVRTTVHTGLINEDDIAAITAHLHQVGYRGDYYIQDFRAGGRKTLGRLPEQERRLDFERIVPPCGINIVPRNFPLARPSESLKKRGN